MQKMREQLLRINIIIGAGCRYDSEKDRDHVLDPDLDLRFVGIGGSDSEQKLE